MKTLIKVVTPEMAKNYLKNNNMNRNITQCKALKVKCFKTCTNVLKSKKVKLTDKALYCRFMQCYGYLSNY